MDSKEKFGLAYRGVWGKLKKAANVLIDLWLVL